MSVVVGDERPGEGLTGLVVVPDGGGHGQDALGDADGDAFEGPAAVGFEVELAFEGVVGPGGSLTPWPPTRCPCMTASAGSTAVGGRRTRG
jgi:hypothetical protein